MEQGDKKNCKRTGTDTVCAYEKKAQATGRVSVPRILARTQGGSKGKIWRSLGTYNKAS